MEKFRPSTDFPVVSNVNSQTTMVGHNRLVNENATCKPTGGVPVLATVDGIKMDNKFEMAGNEESVAQRLEASLSPDSRQRIENLLADIRKLDDKQKLLLYLQLPSGNAEQDVPSKSPSPMLSSCRVDQMNAMNWVRSHIEESPDTSLPKQEVYEEYRSFCENSYHRPLSTADFGKIIKSVFPAVQARRLGTRGNSRYCYSGMRKKLEVTSPSLPPLDAPINKVGVDCIQTTCPGCPKSLLQGEDDHLQKAASQVICEWASGVTNKSFANSLQLAQHLTDNKLVTKSSKSILIVQKHMGEVPRPDLTPEMRHRETNYHLKQTLQYRQEIRKKQAEENQHRLHSSPVSSKQPAEDIAASQFARTDKATQLEQKDVPVLSDGSNGNSLILPESIGGESSTNPENHLSSSNAAVGEGANLASKESPSKRRFAPIQPKTPVRDTGTPMVLISPSAKNVNGQSMFVVMNGQKVIPVQGIPKLTSPQQMILQPGQNVFQSPVQSVTPLGNQTSVNVVSSPVVGNTVLSSPVIPANSIQNAIKGGHYVLVQNNTVKQLRSGLQTATNTNAAIRQNQGQPVATNQVAMVAQAAPPQPHVVVSTSSVTCQKAGLSSQGITYNTGTSNVRSPSVTPVFFDRAAAPASAQTLTSPVNVMSHSLSSQAAPKLASPANFLVRNATSALVPIPLSQSIATNDSSMLKTSVTFATQAMKLPSSVAVVGSDAFQESRVVSNASQSGVDRSRTVPSQFALINSALSTNKQDKVAPVNRPLKNINLVQSDPGRGVIGSSKASIVQNSGSKTVASLLKSKASALSTAPADPSANLVLAQVQNLPRQQDGNKVQHFVIQAAADDVGNSALSGERNALTSAVSGLGPVILNSQELSTLQQQQHQQQQQQQCSILTSILNDQANIQQQVNKAGLPIQTIPVEDTNVNNQLVSQPCVSLLTDADQGNNTMLVVPGMSAATMLPHNKSKSLDTQLLNQLPQTQTALAIQSSQARQTDVTVSLPMKQVGKMQHLVRIPVSQPKMLERLLASENLSYVHNPVQNELRMARSVPTTPIQELQSPPPQLMMRAQSAAFPVHQGDSVPPSPVDGKSFAFTPINTIEFDGGESPLKPKHKPKPTHPTVRSALTHILTNSDVQEAGQNGNILSKTKGKRAQQTEFLTPNRKRRLSSNSKRVAAASPSAVQFQNQMQVRQNVTSPAPNQLNKQQTRFFIQTSQEGLSQGSAAGTGNLQVPSQFLGGGLQNQQATLLRRRNPSGPACPTVNMQISGDPEAELLSLLSNVNPNLQALLDKRALQNRSQSVPLPEQHANRFSRLQLPTQQEVVTNQNPVVSDEIATTQMQIIPIQLGDQGRQVQPTNGFTAKRNLTQDLLNLEVTEEDFAPETLLNTEISSGSNLQPAHSLGETSWPSDQVENVATSHSNVPSQIADFNMIADQQNGNAGHLAQNQTLLQNQAFNDASNSTASSISDDMIIDDFSEKMFQDIGLPPTPWQMGTSNSSLSTLECGMNV